MTPQAKLRALIDSLNKAARLPTGGDGRMTEEALNTSAIAKGQAMDRYKPAVAMKPKSLKELQQS